MFIDGKWEDNISCALCYFRHPARLTCEEALQRMRVQGATAPRDRRNIANDRRSGNDRRKS